MAESQEKDEDNAPESASEALPSKVLYALEGKESRPLSRKIASNGT